MSGKNAKAAVEMCRRKLALSVHRKLRQQQKIHPASPGDPSYTVFVPSPRVTHPCLRSLLTAPTPAGPALCRSLILHSPAFPREQGERSCIERLLLARLPSPGP